MGNVSKICKNLCFLARRKKAEAKNPEKGNKRSETAFQNASLQKINNEKDQPLKNEEIILDVEKKIENEMVENKKLEKDLNIFENSSPTVISRISFCKLN